MSSLSGSISPEIPLPRITGCEEINKQISWQEPQTQGGSRSVVSDPLQPQGLSSAWSSPGQNTGVGTLSLLQGIFPTQGSNPGLPHCRQSLYQLSHKGSPVVNRVLKQKKSHRKMGINLYKDVKSIYSFELGLE